MNLMSDKKFINLASSNLRNFKWKKDNLANCSCPICGDSKKDKKKARGYFYQKNSKFFFKCHNCGFWSNMFVFLEKTDPVLHKEYCIDLWRSKNNDAQTESKESKMLGLLKKESKVSFNSDLPNCTKLSKLSKNHPAYEFADFRKIPRKHWDILYFTEDFGGLAKHLDSESTLIPYDKRIVIPFFNKEGQVVAVQGRSIKMADEHNARKTVKYITVKADKSIDRLWYGMWRANPKKRVHVVEGPIDSLFLNNAVAMVGAGSVQKIPSRFSETDMVFVLDNEPRNKQIVKYNQTLVSSGHKICIWPKNLVEKDINDMVYNMSVREIEKIINDNTFSGLEASLRLKEWSI